MIIVAIFLVLTFIASTASNAIAIKTFNDNPEYKKNNNNQYNYLIASIVLSILLLVISLIFIIYSIVRSDRVSLSFESYD